MEAEREAYQKASFLFPFSKVVAKSLQNDYGIDASKIVTTGAGANFIIGDQKKDFGSLNIIMNGTDFYRKGCDIAVEAMNKVAEKIPGARLFIIGADNGPATANVIYKGRINDKDELSKLFLEADIALGPARCDPYPGFILEAMNFGVPCIVSDRDGMPEMIDHNIDGIVLEDIDSSTLAQYITGLLLNRERLKEFSVACKRKVAMELNWDVAAKKIFNTINNN
jgi:glycosyltransferase involved in cell wall biosynthesis